MEKVEIKYRPSLYSLFLKGPGKEKYKDLMLGDAECPYCGHVCNATLFTEVFGGSTGSTTPTWIDDVCRHFDYVEGGFAVFLPENASASRIVRPSVDD